MGPLESMDHLLPVSMAGSTPEHGDLDSRVMTTTRPVAYDGGALIGLTDKASATA